MSFSYDDLPDLLLVEILCRLPRKEFVFQCKCVSKHWLNLISDPYFIGRFLHLQRFQKKTPIARTLMDRRGEEFPTPRTAQSSSNLLDPLFERVMSFHGLEEKPYVVGTSNDLVLCCRTPYYINQREFYICNPCTRQWIALPPTARCCTHAAVGFISDPYYEEDSTTSGTAVNINSDYRCKVVRILPHYSATMSLWVVEHCKFIVQVFCLETGQWRESIASSPRNIEFADITGVAYNGMLYWTYKASEPRGETGIIRLDPFMIGNGSAASGSPNGVEIVDDDQFQFQFQLFDAVNDNNLLDNPFIYVRRGRLQMWARSWPYENDVWELTGSPDKLYMKQVSVYFVD
ncbi:hypothetical protein ACLB2K_021258 [Fragaria x ananassa]